MKHPKAKQLRFRDRVWVEAAPDYGTAHLAEAFLEAAADDQPRLWLDLDALPETHPVSLGNTLAGAVQAGCSLILPMGLHWEAVLKLWLPYAKLFSPMSYAVTGADRAPELVRGLLELSSASDRWFCAMKDFEALPPPEGAFVLKVHDLHLSSDDLAGLFPQREAKEALRSSGGAYEPFLVELYRRGVAPPPVRPGPEGPRLFPGLEAAVSVDEAIEALRRSGRWEEALALAVSKAPKKLPELLRAGGGYTMFARGKAKKLFDLLSPLTEKPGVDDEVMLWWLGAAQRLGIEEKIAHRVEGYLKAHSAPRLRSVWAVTLAPKAVAASELRRAATEREDELTLYALGYWTNDVELLRQALKLAERAGLTAAAVRNAMSLAKVLVSLGRPQKALYYARYAYELHRREKVVDPLARMNALSTYLYLSLLQGRLEQGVYEELSLLVEVMAETVWRRWATTTLIEFLWLAGDLPMAGALLDRLWEEMPHGARPHLAPFAVHALRTWGEAERALELAEEARAFAEGGSEAQLNKAALALGMALLSHDPETSLEHLEAAHEYFLKRPSPSAFKHHLYQAAALRLLGRSEEAPGLPKTTLTFLEELHSLAYPLVVPTEARPLLSGKEKLVLRFLGRNEALLKGGRLDLRPSYAELLALLALHPEGLTLGELSAYYREGVSTSTVKATLSRLRESVPIASKPYRIAAEYDADFLEVLELVRKKNLSAAIDLYHGPLLPGCTARGVEEQREVIEETLRSAALEWGTGAEVYALAERLGDDLELWEAALERLPADDHRRVLAKAHVRRLQRDYGIT